MVRCTVHARPMGQAIENLDSLTSLTELWLGKNKIVRCEGLDSLVGLTKLDVQVCGALQGAVAQGVLWSVLPGVPLDPLHRSGAECCVLHTTVLYCTALCCTVLHWWAP